MSFTVGETVGAYRILEQLGQGGMATVYKAYHASLDRYVALKVLHPAFLEDKTFLARFEREAKLVARLDHPNIVPIYDYSEHEGRPYLVMKYVEGETLKARIQHGPLGADETLKIVESVGAGLAFAHQRGILHRDIKPSNVLLTTDGSIYIADFGLARIAQSGESTLSSDTILGTPQYISPEQALGKPNLDEGTDIYSFGVMLYEITVGRVPYSADTPFSVIHDHIYAPLPLPSVINPSISADIERFLLKALAKDRADRYADVPAMMDAFKQAWSTGSGTIKPPVTIPMPPAREALTVPPAAPGSSTAAARTVMAAEATPPAAESVPAPQTPAKRRIHWVWIAAGVILCLCCGIVFLATRGIRNNNGGQIPIVVPSIPATVDSIVATNLPPMTQVAAPPMPQVFATPQMPAPMTVRAARLLVDRNPTDPQAHMFLAYALADNGQDKDALDQVKLAADLGAQDKIFLTNTALLLQQRQAWLASAYMYVKAAELYQQQGEPMPGHLIDGMHQSVYFGFEYQTAPDMLEFQTIGRVDEALMILAQARYAFFHRDPDQVKSLLADLEKMKPGMPETKMLKAELAHKSGSDPEARSALKDLINDPTVPEWIRVHAGELLAKIP
jgi:tRNA A-37 threonylcarbamoyl transferase component Bud32